MIVYDFSYEFVDNIAQCNRHEILRLIRLIGLWDKGEEGGSQGR